MLIEKEKILDDLINIIGSYDILNIYQHIMTNYGDFINDIRTLISSYLYYLVIKGSKRHYVSNLSNMLGRLDDDNMKPPTKSQLLYFLFYINSIDLTDDNSSTDSFPSHLYC